MTLLLTKNHLRLENKVQMHFTRTNDISKNLCNYAIHHKHVVLLAHTHYKHLDLNIATSSTLNFTRDAANNNDLGIDLMSGHLPDIILCLMSVSCPYLLKENQVVLIICSYPLIHCCNLYILHVLGTKINYSLNAKRNEIPKKNEKKKVLYIFSVIIIIILNL